MRVKTKIIRISNRHDDNTPITNKANFECAKYFKLLGVLIDNKLKKLAINFENIKDKSGLKLQFGRN